MTTPTSFSPVPSPGNPGQVSRFEVNFHKEEGDQRWTEQIDLPALLSEVLEAQGIAVTEADDWLVTPEGFHLLPQLVGLALDPATGVMSTSTTLQIAHPQLAPQGLFEYQHAHSREDAADAFRQGFSLWAQTDAVTLRDSRRRELQDCTSMNIGYPADDQGPARQRRIVLGPTQHYVDEASPAGQDAGAEEHPFCPCCLLTRSMAAFGELLKSGDFLAIRLYAARAATGEISADCRVNGEDFALGQQALMDYARSWPGQGLEFRKQLVIVQDAQDAAPAE